MNVDDLLDERPEIDKQVKSLSSDDQDRFKRLVRKKSRRAQPFIILLAFLGIYCLFVGLWLPPGYSWAFALLPTIFLAIFIRSQIVGAVVKKNQTTKHYGLMSLPIIFAILCTACGVLINVWFDDKDKKSWRVRDLERKVQECKEYDQEGDKPPYRDCPDFGSDLAEAQRDALDNRSEHVKAIYMSGFLILLVYPASIYYLQSVIRAKNLLLLEEVLEQVGGPKPTG